MILPVTFAVAQGELVAGASLAIARQHIIVNNLAINIRRMIESNLVKKAQNLNLPARMPAVSQRSAFPNNYTFNFPVL